MWITCANPVAVAMAGLVHVRDPSTVSDPARRSTLSPASRRGVKWDACRVAESFWEKTYGFRFRFRLVSPLRRRGRAARADRSGLARQAGRARAAARGAE